MTQYHYPADLLPPLRGAWDVWVPREGKIHPLPPDVILQQAFEICYHASFTADEQRATQFRLIFCEADESRNPIVFDSPREFSTHELMRLAPALAPTELSLGVTVVGGVPCIWGLCDDAYGRLFVSVPRPGTLLVGRNRRTIASLREGVAKPADSEGVSLNLLMEVFESVSRELTGQML